MSKLFFFFIVFCLAYCGLKEGRTVQMKGSYSMTKQLLNDGSKDSLVNRKQYKVYTDHYMMFASQISPTDTLANYGIGTYRIEDGKVIETLFYRSSEGDKKDSAILTVIKTGKGFRQEIDVIEYLDRRYSLIEEYDYVGVPVSTPLDGAWKLIKNIHIRKPGDTIYNNVIQFKVYQDGCFIWANTFQDSTTHRTISGFGYGTFRMDGNNKSTEVNVNSTYASNFVGKPVALDIEFVGNDTYKQVIVASNGDKTIEIYERLP